MWQKITHPQNTTPGLRLLSQQAAGWGLGYWMGLFLMEALGTTPRSIRS